MVHVRRTKDPTLTTPFTDNETLQNFYFTNIFQEANNGATDYRRQTLSLYTFWAAQAKASSLNAFLSPARRWPYHGTPSWATQARAGLSLNRRLRKVFHDKVSVSLGSGRRLISPPRWDRCSMKRSAPKLGSVWCSMISPPGPRRLRKFFWAVIEKTSKRKYTLADNGTTYYWRNCQRSCSTSTGLSLKSWCFKQCWNK